MKNLFIAKPGVIGKWAAEWHLFKQQVLYPSWLLTPEAHLPPECFGELKYLPPGAHGCDDPLRQVAEWIRHLKCHHCDATGYVMWTDSAGFSLVGLDPGHIIGRDREPRLRCSIGNILPECFLENSRKM